MGETMKFMHLFMFGLFVISNYANCNAEYTDIKEYDEIEWRYVMGVDIPNKSADVKLLQQYVEDGRIKNKKNVLNALRAIIKYYCIVYFKAYNNYGEGPWYLRKLFFCKPKRCHLEFFSEFFDLCKKNGAPLYGPDKNDSSQDNVVWENYIKSRKREGMWDIYKIDENKGTGAKLNGQKRSSASSAISVPSAVKKLKK